MNKLYKYFKRRAIIAVTSLFALLPTLIHAEGSKDLHPYSLTSTGYRALLASSTIAPSNYRSIVNQGRMFVYAKAGEKIYLGSSAQGMGAGTIKLTAPNGTLYNTSNSTTIGRISDRFQELKGPSQLTAGGYNAFVQTVLAAEEGIWIIDFIAPVDVDPSPTSVASHSLKAAEDSNPAVPSWSSTNQSSTKPFIIAWDVTVANGTTAIPGRLFMNVFTASMGGASNEYRGKLKVLTNDGFQFDVEGNGMTPYLFAFFSNNKGLRNLTTKDPVYKSANNTDIKNSDAAATLYDFHTPTALDDAANITHKLFYNTPDASMPAFAKITGSVVDVWLNPVLNIAKASNVKLTGIEGSPYMGTPPLNGGLIKFDATRNSNFRIEIDVNNDGDANDAVDRIIFGSAVAGSNSIVWDGKNGQGVAVANGTDIRISIVLFSGEVHFPLIDAENNPNGIKITRTNTGDNSKIIYWNDLALGGLDKSAEPGVDSNTGAHSWNSSFGDVRTIDTWAYKYDVPAVSPVTKIVLKQADLEVVSVTRTGGTSTCANVNVTYTVVARNNGPDHTTGAKFFFTVPAELTGLTAGTPTFTGTGAFTASNPTDSTYEATLDLNNGSSFSITFSGTVSARPASGTLTVKASMLRQPDVTDPDATDPSADVPTDPDAECNYGTVGCNNIKTSDYTILATPNAGTDQAVSCQSTFSLTAAGSGQTWSFVSGPATASIGASSGAVTGMTKKGTYRFKLANGSCDDLVDIVRNNCAPTSANITKTILEDRPYTFANTDFSFTDVDGDLLSSIRIDASPGIGTLKLNGINVTVGQIIPLADISKLVYTPVTDGNGSPYTTFTFSVNDGTVFSTASLTVTINVTPVNDAPVAINDAYSVNEDAVLTIAAKGVLTNDTDVENNTLTVVLVSGPAHGTLTLNADGSFTYTPTANFSGSDSFTYKANDGSSDSNVATVVITVNSVNDAPVANNDAKTTNEDVAVNGTVTATDVDGDALTFTKGSNPTNGSVVVNADGTYTYTPNTNFNGTDSFTVKASDGKGGESTATVTITVTPVNDSPVANNDAKTTNEDVAVSGTVPATDVDGDALTFTKGSNPTNGTVTVNPDGAYTYTPNTNFNGTDSFTVKASDGKGGESTATVTITVTPVNDAPVAVNDAYSVNEDAVLTIAAKGVLTNDTDVENDALTAVLVAGPTHGTLTLNADGSFTYTPTANFSGSDSFTYKANDGSSDSNVATVTLTVTPVNDAPVAINDAYSVNEDAVLTIAAKGVLTNDTDVENNTLTVVLVSGPAHGTLTLNADGSFTYTPTANFSGSDSFTYKANDGSSDSNVATVVITVNSVNDAPVANNDAKATNEDVAVNGTVTATDVDGDALTFTKGSNPTNGSVVVNADGTYTYTPNTNFNGTDSFTVKASDGKGGESTATVTITVTPVNDSPVANNDAKTTSEDVAVSGTVTATDVDGDALTFTKGSNPTNGTVTVNPDGAYTYTPNTNFNGTDSFTVKASDGKGGESTATVTITVTPVNDAPVAVNDAYSVNEDAVLTIAAKGVLTNDTDVENNTLTAVLVSGPTHGTLTLNADGSFTYTPTANYSGSDSFTYKANDGSSDSNVATVTLTVTPVNDAPVAVNDVYSVNEDVVLTIAAKGVLTNDTDVENNTLTAVLVSGPAHGTLTLNADGSFTYTPTANFNGIDSFTYKANDGSSDSNVATVAITVNSVNDAPVANNDAKTTSEDVAVSGTVTATDVDGDALTFTKGSNPTNGTVTVNPDGAYTYTPNTNFNGTDSFTVKASDGKGGESTATVTITVTPVNDAPVAVNDAYSVNEDAVLTIAAKGVLTNDTDVENDALTAVLVAGPTHGTLTLNADGSFTYTPTANFSGSDSFTYKANDGSSDSNVATVAITVNSVNDAPVANNDAKTTNEDVAVNGTVTATDVDGDALTFTKGSNPTNGSVVVNADGTYTYTPSANFNGTDSFTVKASDGKGGESTATMTITVTPVNDAPVANNDAKTTNEDVTVNGTVTATDVDGDALTFTKGSNPTNGSVVVNADGTYTYTPNANFNGTDSFTVKASDGKGGESTATVTITVTPVNDAPVAVNDSYSVNEDVVLTIAAKGVLTNDTDVENNTLTAVLVSGPTHGTLTLNADGSFTYTPTANFSGSDSFTYKANDGSSDSNVATVAITVNSVNDAPVANNDAKTTNEDVAVNGTVTATDVDGDALTFTKGSNPTNGSVVVNADGTYTYMPNANFNGTDSFTVKASDGKGGESTATVTITVTPVKDAPVANNDAKTTSEDVAVNGTVTATDVDGDTLTFTKGSNPTNGTVTVNADGTYTYTPNANFNGTDSFTVKASDGKGGESTATVTITVTPVNDAPIVTTNPVTTEENKLVSGKVTSTDVDGDTLIAEKGTDPTNGTVVVNPDGTYTYTPKPGFNGKDSFEIVVKDGKGGETKVVVDVTVTPVNDAPVASNDSKTTNEDTPVNGKVAATDPDGDTLIFTKGNNPSNGTVVVNPDGTYTYTPNTDFNGKDSFEIVIKDGKGGETTVVIEVTVNPVNDAPVASNDSKTTNEDTPVNGKVTATDAEGDALTFTKGSNPTNGSVVVNIDGTYTYTPNADFNGKDSFDFIIKDGKGGETKVVIDVTVTPVNDAPIVTVDPVSTDENKPVTGKVTAKDADGDAPTAEKGTDPTNGTVVVNPDGTYTYTPKPGFNGKDSFEIVVKDGKGGETKVIVDVTVSPVNDAPVASNDNKTTNEDTPVSGKITATDADGDAMTFIKGSNPSNGTVVVNADGTYTYTPNADFNGTDSFTVKVSDGKGGETTATITITVKAVNDAPVVTAGPVTTTENTPVSGKVTSTDADGDPLTAEKGTDPANGTVVVNPDGTYTYTPKPGFNGKDSFEIVVKDGKGGETKVVVDVTVDPANNTADLMIEKRIVKSTSDLKVGDWVQYEIVVTSKGPAKATNVKVADKLMTLLGKPEDVKSDIGNVTYSDAAHGIDWVIGIMDANTKATLTFKSQIVKAGKLTNSATVSSDVKDDNTVNNTGTTPVDVVDNKPVFVPNAFTPNGDGKNERFTIPGIEQYPGSTLHIFNRWGNEVFYSGSYDNEWVGQGLSEGTYFYILTINKLEGKTIQKGWVLLKR